MADQLKHKVISGLFWRGTEKFGTQAVGFAIALILARILPTKDFGTIAIVSAFIGFANIFVDSGFSAALIQKKETDEHDYNSVFYINLATALMAYFLCYLFAPMVSGFYQEDILTKVLRVAALSLPIGVFSSIQQAVMNREMRFKLSLRVTLIALSLSSITGIGLACAGFGVWSLVFSQLAGATATSTLLWFSVAWRPRVIFSRRSAGSLFQFGSKYLFGVAVTQFYVNLSTLLIGKYFSISSLAYYSRGYLFPSYIVSSVCGTINGVLFPALSSCQNDRRRMTGILRRSVSTSTFILFPMLVGLAVVAKPLILVLLTEKWLPSVPYLAISCLTVAFWPVLGINVQAINACGRSDIFFKMEVLNKAVAFAVFFASLPYGMMAVVVGQAMYSLLMCLVCYPWINSRYLGYSYREQMGDIAPALGCALGMGILILPIGLVVKTQLALLVGQIAAGVVCYSLLCHLFKIRSYTYLLAAIRGDTSI